MKKEYFTLALSFFSCIACAGGTGTTVTSKFVITNRTIESATISSTDSTMNYSDETGSGLYKIHDSYTDANIEATKYGNQQFGLLRNKSLVSIPLIGVNLRHTIIVNGKLANSSVQIPGYTRVLLGGGKNNGCIQVSPIGYAGDIDTVVFTITSSNDVTKDCSGNTGDYGFTPYHVPVQGLSRDFYLDIGRLQNDPVYRRAPPDTYVGTGTFMGEVLKNRVGNGYTPYYRNTITIVKNPYFEGVTMPSGDNVFDTRTTGGQIKGNLVIPYVINGQFTPYNTISLNVNSLNGFKLKSIVSSAEIPYSLSTTVGSQRVYPLATDGKGAGSVTISNLEAESYAIQGRFNADFSIDKNNAQTGDYSDILTAIFQITL
ncbi:fimbrial protein [Salmonella enterica subsp. enterica serovar Oranienburg]|nr:fimbrial protein [Salmonella enterica subsp. enterica serovar Newport]EBW6363660.1 fimbrial protein [Salmonella enterica subsp. enterica serovar Oranienburg]EDU7787014.1 fimbrial protein [Salmonella enterica subsp. enterica serovar Oranienburg]HAK8202973.1 fimbrial protein [Salmonella enterica]